MANKFNFGGMDKKAKQAMKEAITIIANDAKNHYIKSFKDGGFTDDKFEAWKPRKKETKDTIGRAILTSQKADLKKSIIDRINLSQLKVVFSSDLIYAPIHNYGLMGKAWGKHPFKMPQRQFIGKSAKVDKMAINTIEKKIDSLFK
jgi:phage gpG-like protein